MLYRQTVSKDQDEVIALMKRISARCPNVAYDVGDYGLRLIGWLRDEHGNAVSGTAHVICQPARLTNGQPEVVADVDHLIKLWGG